MSLIRKCNMGYINPLVAKYLDHHLSLVGGYHFVLKALQKDNRAIESLGMMYRRSFFVDIFSLGIWSN